MIQDQCPSTTGKKDPAKARPAHSARALQTAVGAGSGRAYWRSLDDLADTSEFRDFLEREFPAGASELLEGSRRTFMKLMGASVTLAGAATLPGCRRPDHKIMPYSKNVPEETIPGKAEYYATSMPLPGGGAEGLLVESHEGRPTKVEGNPLHPVNRGKSSVWSQGSVLGLYDPDRLMDPVPTISDTFEVEADGKKVQVDMPAGAPTSWEVFGEWARRHFAQYDRSKGAGLAFLVEKKSSPTRESIKAGLLLKWPQAVWVAYDPTESDEPVRGSAVAFGRPMREMFAVEKAKVIVTLDRDFLQREPLALVNARGFAAGRRVLGADDEMNRLYMVESNFSITGGKADHRLRLAPSLIPGAAVALARAILAKQGVQAPAGVAEALNGAKVPGGIEAKWIEAVAEDVVKAGRGKSLIMAGATQPAAVHALVHALNGALGNAGSTVSYVPMSEEEGASSSSGLASLCELMEAGKVTTLVCANVNPVYDAPPEAGFAAKFNRVPTRITLSLDDNETVAASTWKLNGAHYLESWGDTEAWDGTVAPIQPLIAPLYNGRSDIELLAIIGGEAKPAGYDLVRAAWKTRGIGGGEAGFEKAWRRALHNGVLIEGGAAEAGAVRGGAVGAAIGGLTLTAGPADTAMDVVFTVGHVADGRYANCTWLQELPDTATKVVWDNVVMMGPGTAKRLGVMPERETVKKRGCPMTTVTIGERSIDMPAWVLPGLPENTVILPLGYGREVCGRVGRGVGFNTYRVKPGGKMTASGARVARAQSGEWYNISTTQQHGTLEGRAIVREVDLAAWRKFAKDPFVDLSPEQKERMLHDAYGRPRDLNFAERLGEATHSPANISIYENPFNLSKGDPDPSRRERPGAPSTTARRAGGGPPAFTQRPQWGMSIDLSTCIGCNTCTIACQAENNIPSVGKIEVNKAREMHWIRVDRYFVSDADLSKRNPAEESPEDPNLSMVYQPLACVHCENAPCETVCPVNATIHGPEGINYMAYNRCIGTRYCANNCPYKVRRFNFFDFGVAKFNGDFVGKEVIPGDHPKNVNLVPPRLRQRLDEITKMQMNPDVTVRSRGVMEKCTYCIQRINEARVEVKLQNLPGIPDGFFQAACQQACPTDAITFGDILDTTSNAQAGSGAHGGSRVRAMREHGRSYLLLGFLNTRPRTTHMVSVRNPNPALREPITNPFHHGGEGGGHEEHGKEHALGGGLLDKGHKMSLTVLSAAGGVA